MLQYGTRCQFDCFKWDETIREAVMKSMQGTPYHVEALRRNEDDPRRYWGRCRLVDFNTQMCLLRGRKCTFCTRCDMYDPVTEEEFKKRQRQKQHQKYIEKHPTRVARVSKESICKEVINRKEMKSSSDSSSERKFERTKEKKDRNFYIKVGKMILHDRYGKGQIIGISGNSLFVQFASRRIKFAIPQCFMSPEFHLMK